MSVSLGFEFLVEIYRLAEPPNKNYTLAELSGIFMLCQDVTLTEMGQMSLAAVACSETRPIILLMTGSKIAFMS